MLEKKQEETIIVCPNAEKIKILNQQEQEQELRQIKFMTKEEFKQSYFFTYDAKTYEYLLKKYHYNLDVIKVYLENLYVIDEHKNYKNEKLNFLKNLKIELKENNLLEENHLFQSYIKNRKIQVKNYYDLEKYEEQMLKTTLSYKPKPILKEVIEYETLEEEVNGVCLKIIQLLKQKVDINKIYLTNITEEYNYTIEKLFSYYHIPINLKTNTSIYGTKVVKDFLKEQKLDLENKNKAKINKKLINILAKLSNIEQDSEEYKILLEDELKNTLYKMKKFQNAIQIKDLYQETFTDDEYVFVLGFNQDVLPKLDKDTDYINDAIKEEVPLYSTKEKNKRKNLALTEILGKIKNLFLSYKLSSPFQTFYRSSLINDLNLKVIKEDQETYTYSNQYNKLRLAEKLDLYYLYNEIDQSLKTLYTHYQIPYKSYKNDFTGIKIDKYLENLPYPLKLSYTSLNTYNECKFKYYIKYILNLEPYTKTFATFIGSLYHKILSLYQKTNFNFEEEYNKYIKEHELTLKDKLLLKKIKKDLLKLIDILNQQQLITGFDNFYFEKKIEIPIKQSISVIFTGYIDKIMYYQKIEDTYFSIIDYKTGTIDTHIEPMKYGLHMQLPVYLYLIHYSKVFSNPIFTGIYYQNILFNYPTWNNKDLQQQEKEKYMLQGYSTEDITILEKFDSTVAKSEYIKSMSYNEEKGFGTYSKILNNDTLFELIQFTKNHIEEKTEQILAADFKINPKVYDGKNISCEYCKFNDLCYKKEADITYLEKVEDLSFLGGTDHGMDKGTATSN